jgi:hypothetical protein
MAPLVLPSREIAVDDELFESWNTFESSSEEEQDSMIDIADPAEIASLLLQVDEYMDDEPSIMPKLNLSLSLSSDEDFGLDGAITKQEQHSSHILPLVVRKRTVRKRTRPLCLFINYLGTRQPKQQQQQQQQQKDTCKRMKTTPTSSTKSTTTYPSYHPTVTPTSKHEIMCTYPICPCKLKHPIHLTNLKLFSSTLIPKAKRRCTKKNTMDCSDTHPTQHRMDQ